MKKIKVLHLITDLGKGGAERFLIDLCKQMLTRRDVKFKIAVLYDNNLYKSDTEALPIEILNYSTFEILRVNKCEKFTELLDSFRPDIIHAHRFLGEFITSYDLRGCVSYVCHGHDNMIQFRPLTWSDLFKKQRLLHVFEKGYLIFRKYLTYKTHFISNSPHTDSFYKKVLPLFTKTSVNMIPYGFDYEKFYNPEPKKLPKESEELIIINIGSFQTKKNQVFILEIAKELLTLKVKFRIHLLGDGENKKLVEEKVQQYGLQKNVFLHGNVDNVEDWLKWSHIYIHTAVYEPFGLVFLEAMASGLPCIALDGKGNKILVENGRNGFLIKEQDATLFVDKIVFFIQNESTYSEMSEYSKTYSSAYSIESRTNELIDFYKIIIDGRQT